MYEVGPALRQVGEHRGAPAARVRHRGHREPAHQLGPHHGGGPREVSAQVVSHERRVGLAEGAHDAGDVEGQVGGVVPPRRTVAAAHPAQVHGHRAVPGVRERRQLMPPGPPELREAVQQQHQRPVAHLGDVEARAVGRHIAVDPRTIEADGGGGIRDGHADERATDLVSCPTPGGGASRSGGRTPSPWTRRWTSPAA